MARQYNLKHLVAATVVVFAVVFAIDLYRDRDRTGPFQPRPTCIRTLRSLGAAVRAVPGKPARDQLVHGAVASGRKAGLVGLQASGVALYMNFSGNSASFDTSALARRIVDAVCGPTPGADSSRIHP